MLTPDQSLALNMVIADLRIVISQQQQTIDALRAERRAEESDDTAR